VVSDVMMPRMDGFELLQALRKDPSTAGIPIILLSARAGEESKVEGLDKGADDYLVKPFTARELFSRVRSHLDLAQRRRKAQEQLQRANDELESRVAQRTAQLALEKARLLRSNEELEQFAGVAAHDLRAPLKLVRTWVDLLGEDLQNKPQAEVDKALELIKRNLDKANVLIRDILAVARVEFPENREEIDLNIVVRDIIQNLQGEFEKVKVDFQLGSLPAVKGIRGNLESLFANLLRNAVQYRDKGRALRIEVGSKKKDGRHLFWVKDNGMGIDPGDLTKVFAMFKRLHDDQEHPGTGIGLAYCKKVVELSGGKIWAESTGAGTTFYFTLPLSNVEVHT
jgi:light-regulated signal transduction histidine kinase (bacteriophytochrome)